MTRPGRVAQLLGRGIGFTRLQQRHAEIVPRRAMARRQLQVLAIGLRRRLRLANARQKPRLLEPVLRLAWLQRDGLAQHSRPGQRITQLAQRQS